MSIAIILSNLTQNRMITLAEETALKQAPDDASFLISLVGIYQKKVEIYLNACHSRVKSSLQAAGIPPAQCDAQTVEKTIACAYSALLAFDQFSSIASLKLLLEKSEPDLLVSTGLSALTHSGNLVHETARQVFIAYMARYRLWRSVDRDALENLCRNVEPQNPLLFPTYLTDTFRLEELLSNGAKTHSQGGNLPHFLAGQVQSSTDCIRECLRGGIFYLSTIVDSSPMTPTVRNQHFAHLVTRQEQVDFAGAVAEGYISEMQQLSNQVAVEQAKVQTLALAVSQICFPALCLLDLPVSVDLTTLQNNIRLLQDALAKTNADDASFQAQKQQLAQDFLAAQRTAHEQIDAWRANIPKRPITFGLRVGVPL